jgi:single-stranded DNA-binding protein
MNITAKRLSVGTDVESKFIGKNGTLLVTFSAAENHNKNVGSKENPEWETVGTSWYRFEAWGEVAENVLTTLQKGDQFELVSGLHKIDKRDDKFYPKYTIFDFEKIEKSS